METVNTDVKYFSHDGDCYESILFNYCSKKGATKHYTETLHEVLHVRVSLNFSV